MFIYRVRLFSLFGFKVYMDASWLLLALLIVWSLALGVFPSLVPGYRMSIYVWMGIAAAAGLLLSIVLHETAHALVARRLEMPIRDITLFIFGGVAEMEGEPTSARGELLMAAAGPVTSAALGLLLMMGSGVAMAVGGFAPAAAVLGYLGTLNWLLAIFNLIPAFPLDGGRMLRAMLWSWRKDFASATRIAAGSGQIFGLILILIGLLQFLRGAVLNGVWLFLIGLFLRGAASLANQEMLTRKILGGEPVSRFMTPNPISVPPDLSIQNLVDDYIYRHHHGSFPVTRDGRLVGCIGTADITMLDRSDWSRRTVAEQMRRCGEDEITTPDTDALQAMAKMSRTKPSRLFVTDGDRLVGVLSLRDLVEFLRVKLELERPRHVQEPGLMLVGPAAR
ncbi:site-2 protease family protein [Sphingomonas oleivorans]|uniref:Zinc metalloprotease n=1 Tax=Sphingomonas oleivorans TaxID=1735121 RepID=A0A2T5G2F2_9SPHN|nr:site-2 protease family protein [Sphingomonas oleivorans]PTQ13300.1 site-2 protease family protein [Sphingomonas oleivorans]